MLFYVDFINIKFTYFFIDSDKPFSNYQIFAAKILNIQSSFGIYIPYTYFLSNTGIVY